MEAREIYSEMEPEKQEKVLAELTEGRIDCIVQVQMLGEGFDHPLLSVAATFRPFRSLSPYIQFVGRIMRVIHQDDPGHPDNHGYVVSHIGLNNDSNWRDFRDVDFDDQQIFHKWLNAPPEEDGTGSGGEPRRFDNGMLVQDEIVSHFIGQSFLNPDDDRVLDEILAQKVPGTPFTVGDLKSRNELRKMLKQRQQAMEVKPQEIPVSPQRRRRAARTRLSERTNSVVARILKDLRFSAAGRDVSKVTKMGNLDNRAAITRLLNGAINALVGIESRQRNTLTAAQTEQAFGALDSVGDQVRDSIKSKIKK